MKNIFLVMITTVLGLLIFVLSACRGNESVSLSTISVDGKDAVSVDIRDASICKIVQLETTEQSLLADIEQVEIVGNKMFVYSSGNSDKVTVFDREGKFLFNVGKFGAGPGEYRRIASFFIDNSGDICLYDSELGVILRYDENGKYLSKKEVAESSISSICPVGEDKFIGKSKYRGERALKRQHWSR